MIGRKIACGGCFPNGKGHSAQWSEESRTFAITRNYEENGLGTACWGTVYGSCPDCAVLWFRELGLHLLLSASRWRPVQEGRATGRNGQVTLAATWRPQLLFLDTCPLDEERSQAIPSIRSPPVSPLRPGQRWPCLTLHPLPFRQAQGSLLSLHCPRHSVHVSPEAVNPSTVMLYGSTCLLH